MGNVVAVCISERKGEQKQSVGQAFLEEGHGLNGDAHAGSWHRQVSLLDRADIEFMRSRGVPDLQYGAFGENLVVSGVDLEALGLGSRLHLGEQAELAITQRGKVCHQRCSIFYKAGDCIMPTRGLFGRVTKSGAIAPGAPVDVIERVPTDLFQAVVLTISDKGASGERPDTAGPAVVDKLRGTRRMHVYGVEILPDERERISERLRHYCDGHGIDLVVAVGGTGFSPRDVTPEAVRDVADRLTPGLDEAMRAASLTVTPHAMLSRAVSAIRNQTLIVSLPGSPKAALENLDAIMPALPHGLDKLRGSRDECATPPGPGTQDQP